MGRRLKKQNKQVVHSQEFVATFSKALSLHQGGQIHEAKALYQELLDQDPQHLDSLNNLAMILFAEGQIEEAGKVFEKITELAPNNASYWSNLSVCLEKQKQFEAAKQTAEKALKLQNPYPEALNNLANAYKGLKDFDKAISLYTQALDQAPQLLSIYKGLASAYAYQQKHEAAISTYRKAMALNDKDPDVQMGLGTSLFATGHFKEGFEHYLWRWQSDNFSFMVRQLKQPKWQGEPLEGKTLLIYWEQGVGDTLQFSRFVPLMVKRYPNTKIYFEVQRHLFSLYSYAFKDLVEVIPYHNIYGSNLPEHDYQVPLVDLGHYLGIDETNLPSEPYLSAPDPFHYKETDEFVVGISWYSKSPEGGALRSLALEDFLPFKDLPRLRLIDLQYGDTKDEREKAKEKGLILFHDERVKALEDLGPFANQVAGCDLVISIDNTTVHMAGALGIPVWTLLPEQEDWRWMLQRSDTPWYACMRLFRQEKGEDKTAPLLRARDELEKLLLGKL